MGTLNATLTWLSTYLSAFATQVWESAVNIAMNNKKERISEVVNIVAQRLVQNNRHEAAAELLQGIDDMQGAVK